MARTARAPADLPPAPMPWHKRYRLLVQLAALAALAGILAVAVLLVFDKGSLFNEENRRLLQENRPALEQIAVPPADLPVGWRQASGGIGIHGTLRIAGMGPATAAAESVLGQTGGWTGPEQVRLISVGVIVAQNEEIAAAAFERLQQATLAEVVRYVDSPEAVPVSMDDLPVRDPDRFGRLVAFSRGSQVDPDDPDAEGPPLNLSVLLIWARQGDSLFFVALNDFFLSPPRPAPVDMERWLDDAIASFLAARAALTTTGSVAG